MITEKGRPVQPRVTAALFQKPVCLAGRFLNRRFESIQFPIPIHPGILSRHNVRHAVFRELQQRFQCALRQQVVGIAEGKILALCHSDSFVSCRSGAAVRNGDDADLSMRLPVFLQDSRRGIGRSVIHTDDLDLLDAL